jgi:hypothetical protein
MPSLPLALLEGIGPLLLVIFWVIRQVMVATAEAKARKKDAEPEPFEGFPERPVRRPQQRVGEAERGPVELGPAGDRRAEGGQRDLRNEVEEFLRRINETGQPAAPADSPPKRPARGVDPFDEPARRTKPRRPASVESAAPTETSVSADPAAMSRTEAARATFNRPKSHLAEQAAHLGQKIAQTDERAADRVHQKFDHQVGTIGPSATANPGRSQETPGTAPKDTRAKQLRERLASPAGMREAILLNEILSRPVDRW